MPWLSFQISGETSFSFALDGSPVTFGRELDNTFQIDDSAVSRHHARLFCADGDPNGVWTLTDRQSFNGTSHNGERIAAPVILLPGDSMEIGALKFTFQTILARTENAAPPSEPEAVPAAPLPEAAPPPPTASALPAPPPLFGGPPPPPPVAPLPPPMLPFPPGGLPVPPPLPVRSLPSLSPPFGGPPLPIGGLPPAINAPFPPPPLGVPPPPPFAASSQPPAIHILPPAENVPAAYLAEGLVLADAYRLEEFLGNGPGYRSYRAQEIAYPRPVSIRLLDPELLQQAGALDQLGHAVERLQTHPHPNLIAPLALREAQGWIFVVSEWLPGVPLLDVLRRRHALPVREALLVLAQAASAADHARAHYLPPPDLSLRPALLAVSEAAPDGGNPDPGLPLDRWPPFVVKLAPLFANLSRGASEDDVESTFVYTPHWVQSEAPTPPLCALLCELLGHSLQADGAGQPKAPRLSELGEAGNDILRRGLSQHELFGSGAEFCAALAQAVGVTPG